MDAIELLRSKTFTFAPPSASHIASCLPGSPCREHYDKMWSTLHKLCSVHSYRSTLLATDELVSDRTLQGVSEGCRLEVGMFWAEKQKEVSYSSLCSALWGFVATRRTGSLTFAFLDLTSWMPRWRRISKLDMIMLLQDSELLFHSRSRKTSSSLRQLSVKSSARTSIPHLRFPVSHRSES